MEMTQVQSPVEAKNAVFKENEKAKIPPISSLPIPKYAGFLPSPLQIGYA